ncbi:MAG: protein-L-isoaspartate(D-aspartate) O-methyltransferase [Elusimicrobiota bacterium]|nr:protein-L-isoaspartate(D-aspartate) O-methyltransferase [Elusimicrobiota bacterium]
MKYFIAALIALGPAFYSAPDASAAGSRPPEQKEEETLESSELPQEHQLYREAVQMIENQLKERGIENKKVLEAMLKVPRHEFVPRQQRLNAYSDRPLAIGWGQTISQPFIVAYMTEIISLQPGDRVLEIGTGSGYQASVLAEIVDKVYTVEIIRPLGERAKEDIENLGYKNIEVKLADGYYGWEEAAPFDAIVVTAAAQYIPPPLIRQLSEGGRMIIPVGHPYQTQYLTLVEKTAGEVSTRRLIPVRFVPLTREE